MSSEVLAKTPKSAIKKAIGMFHDLKQIIVSWVDIFARCRNSCCHFPTFLVFKNVDAH